MPYHADGHGRDGYVLGDHVGGRGRRSLSSHMSVHVSNHGRFGATPDSNAHWTGPGAGSPRDLATVIQDRSATSGPGKLPINGTFIAQLRAPGLGEDMLLGQPRSTNKPPPPRQYDTVVMHPQRMDELAQPLSNGNFARLAAAASYRVPDWLGGQTSAIKDALIPPRPGLQRKKDRLTLSLTDLQKDHQVLQCEQRERERERASSCTV